MDAKLVAWGRAVKRRAGIRVPLWLVTDAARLGDPLPVVARLPRGLCGVVLRDDALPGRAALARALARLCRSRRLVLSIAGDWRLAASVGAGVHARRGRWPAGMPRWLPVLTSSAHGAAELRRARRMGAIGLLSPAFATATHAGARGLGPPRWGLAARAGGGAVALGGIDGASIRRLPARHCRGAAAIGAFAARP